ncbi:MAG: cell division protein FtsQ/DivIB [Thiohalobacteraceae bacterium]
MARRRVSQARLKQPPLPLYRRMQPLLRPVARVTSLALFAAALTWGVTWLRDPHTLPLRSVRIEGEFRKLSSEQLQAAIAASTQGGFFTVDVEAVRRAAEALPWVASASVRRIWPDGLRLHVVEQRAVARWGETGLLNTHGQLFEPAAETLPGHLPRLDGPDALRRRVMEQYIAITGALVPIGRRVAILHIDDRRAWQLTLDDGIELQLGRDDTLVRVQRFVRVYPQLFAVRETELKTVDMRYSNGFAVRWDQPQQTAGEQKEG